MKKRGLGNKGLNALLAGSKKKVEETAASQEKSLIQIPLECIQRGQYQPRRDIDGDALEELAQSIKQQGVMQPIVVRELEDDHYEIIAGERRWRASQLAGKENIPAIIHEVSDEAAVAMALIENIQRENLNPIEEAMAFQRLQSEFNLTQTQVAEAVGKSRSAVTNLMRLLALAEDVKLMLERGDMEMGHARALLTLNEQQQSETARLIVGKGLSVRQTEEVVRRIQAKKDSPTSKPAQPEDPDVKRLQETLSERLGSSVRIKYNAKGKGKLVIQYNSLDELDGILSHIQ